MTPLREICVLIGTVTCSATAGTRSVFTHNLGYTPSADRVMLQPVAADADGALSPCAAFVKADSTTLTIRASIASMVVKVWIWLQTDSGGRNFDQ